jgi:hypothetical protein
MLRAASGSGRERKREEREKEKGGKERLCSTSFLKEQ